MAGIKPGPIVITLKNRAGPRRVDPEKEEEEEKEAPAPSPDVGPATRDRSRSRSPVAPKRQSPSPLPPLRGSGMDKSSMLNVAALEDIFSRFHGQLDTWLQDESSKLERAEARGAASTETLRKCGDKVTEFLRSHAPRVYADLGTDPAGEGFASRILPQFLEILDEDRRALQETFALLGAFAERRFPGREELAGPKADGQPLPMLRALLRMLASPKTAAAAAEPKGSGSRGATGRDDGRGNRRAGDAERGRSCESSYSESGTGALVGGRGR